MEVVLAHIAANEIENVLFLSGDEHLSCIARARLQAENCNPVEIVSIHGSPLYAPLPFANGRASNFQAKDSFSFLHQSIRIDIASETRFSETGDGFALIVIQRQPHDYIQHVEFIGEEDKVSVDLQRTAYHS